jgi:hypothetical protein
MILTSLIKIPEPILIIYNISSLLENSHLVIDLAIDVHQNRLLNQLATDLATD